MEVVRLLKSGFPYARPLAINIMTKAAEEINVTNQKFPTVYRCSI